MAQEAQQEQRARRNRDQASLPKPCTEGKEPAGPAWEEGMDQPGEVRPSRLRRELLSEASDCGEITTLSLCKNWMSVGQGANRTWWIASRAAPGPATPARAPSAFLPPPIGRLSALTCSTQAALRFPRQGGTWPRRGESTGLGSGSPGSSSSPCP